MRKTLRGPQILTFKVPNRLILDGSLSFNARRLGTVLFSRRNQLGACRRSLAALAGMAQCSVTTTRKSLEELIDAGYITRCKHYKYSEADARLVYDQYTYHCNLRFLGGFTLVPRSIFQHPLKSSSFVVCLYLYHQAGNGKRSYPSLSRICKDLAIAKSTVCRAIRALGNAKLVYAQGCVKVNGSHSCNSYFFLCMANPSAPVVPLDARDVSNCLGTAQLRKLLCSMAVPFPCLYSTPRGRRKQGPLPRGGSFKIGKLKLKT